MFSKTTTFKSVPFCFITVQCKREVNVHFIFRGSNISNMLAFGYMVPNIFWTGKYLTQQTQLVLKGNNTLSHSKNSK